MSDHDHGDEDDSDESDIGEKFQQAKAQQQAKKRKQRPAQAANDSDSDDGDGDSESEDEGSGSDGSAEVTLLAARGMSKKKKGTAVDEKLLRLQHRQAVQGRKDRLRANPLDDDSDNDDEIQFVGVGATGNKVTDLATKVTVHKHHCDDDDDDSSKDSDDDNVQCLGTKGRPSMQELQQRGAISEQDALEFQKLKAAADQLQTQENGAVTGAAGRRVTRALQEQALAHQQRLMRAQLYDAAATRYADPAFIMQQNFIRQQHANANAMVQHQHQQQEHGASARQLTLTLTVIATIHIVLSNETTEKTCVVTVVETEKVQAVIDKALQQLKLNPKTNVVGLQYDGRALKNRHSLDMFGIPAKATLQATIHSSDFAGGGAAAAPAVVDVGRLISVTLRRDVDGRAVEDCMRVGMKEKLQSLADKYAKAMGLSAVKLHFDGDAMNLNNTPAAYEMEDEDLIDVVV